MSLQQQAGLTLIEVVVTMFVMTVGLMGLAGMQATTLKAGLDSAQQSQAMWLVTDLAERMRANPGGLSVDYLDAATAVSAAACGAAPPVTATICSDNSNGFGSACATPREMAFFDVWEVYCGHNTAAGTIAGPADSLKLTAITITCTPLVAGLCEATAGVNSADFTIGVTWDSEAANQVVDNAGNTVINAANSEQVLNITLRP